MPYLRACLLSLPLFVLAAPLAAQQREEVKPEAATEGDDTAVELFTGAEFQEIELSDGRKVEKFSIPMAAQVTAGRVRVTAQLPYMRVKAPGDVVVPSGPLGLPILVDPAGPAEISTREGIGDLRVDAAYQLPISGLNASVSGGVKLPTASTEKGLGTGETDYRVGADLSKTVGAVTPFAGMSYTKVGDPADYDLEDTLAGHAGAAVRLGRSASAHIGYSYEENASGLVDDQQRVFGGVNAALGSGLSLGVYGSAGVNGPADIGAGISLDVRLD